MILVTRNHASFGAFAALRQERLLDKSSTKKHTHTRLQKLQSVLGSRTGLVHWYLYFFVHLIYNVRTFCFSFCLGTDVKRIRDHEGGSSPPTTVRAFTLVAKRVQNFVPSSTRHRITSNYAYPRVKALQALRSLIISRDSVFLQINSNVKGYKI